MSVSTPGLHHVTAISGDPQRTVDFYGGVLGLRLVKRTVNFDDPSTLHLYFGDEGGRPGTLVTFFPWGDAPPGRGGTGQINTIALAIPRASLGWWIERLIARGIAFDGPTKRFDEQLVTLRDVDGIALELVASDRAGDGWEGGGVPRAHAVRGVHGVTLWVEALEPTARFLGDALGFRASGNDASSHRFEAGAGGSGTVCDVRVATGFWRGAMGVGTVHHVAWRTPTDESELAARDDLVAHGAHVTPVRDRVYFHSIYFHEPGGTLFEIATDPPGFTLDEPLATLGAALKLPPWLESERAKLDRVLPTLHAP